MKYQEIREITEWIFGACYELSNGQIEGYDKTEKVHIDDIGEILNKAELKFSEDR